MSHEEQDQILGRLVRESRESGAAIAALEAKLLQMSRHLSDAAAAIHVEAQPAAPINATDFVRHVPEIRSAVSKIPTAEAVLSAVAELEDLRKRQEERKGQIARMTG